MIKNNFNGGIFGKQLRYRADLEKYMSSVAELENFLVLPYGGIENRPGTVMLKQYPADSDIRLVTFQFNNNERFILAFSKNHLDIFNAADNSLSAELDVIFGNVWNLSFEQKNDIIWITSPDYFPKTLKRFSDKNWDVEDFQMKNIPFTDNMDSELEFELEIQNVENVDITCNQNFFTEKMVGAIIRIYSNRTNMSVKKTFTADGNSDSLEIFRTWRLLSSGTWVGTVYLERSFDSGETWETYRQYQSNANNNIDDSGYEEEFRVLYRCRLEGWEKAPSGEEYQCRITLSMDDSETFNDAKIKEFLNNNTVRCEMLGTFNGGTKTSYWALSSWNGEWGFPKVVSFTSGDRLAFANTKHEPQTIWMSQVSNYNNFFNDTQADSAISWSIITNLYNEINWILNSKQLLLGMSNEIGAIAGKDKNKALTIDNREYSAQIEIAASEIPPIKVNESLLLLKRGKKALLELAYNYDADGFVAPNLSLAAPELLKSGVRQMAFQEQPYPLVWLITADGNCASFTYNKAESVMAWAKHTTNGEYLSVCSAASNTEDDDVFFAVRRKNGVFIEKMAKRTDDDIEQMIFTDCSIRVISENGTASISELTVPHLADMDVVCLLDGSPAELTADENGRIILPYACSNVLAGLPYQSYMASLPFEMMNGTQSTLAQKKTAQNIIVKFYNSVGGEFSLDGIHYSQVISRRTSDVLGAAVLPESYTAELLLRSTYQYETVLHCRQTAPLPLTILAYELDIMQS